MRQDTSVRTRSNYGTSQTGMSNEPPDMIARYTSGLGPLRDRPLDESVQAGSISRVSNIPNALEISGEIEDTMSTRTDRHSECPFICRDHRAHLVRVIDNRIWDVKLP